MPRLFRLAGFFVLIVAVDWRAGMVHAEPDAARIEATESGSIEGKVIYRADAARRWRYSRYYIKNAKSGELAEAIVALQGKRLGKAAISQPAEIRIDQKDFQFHPETVAIRRGDSVKFSNSDRAAHNIRSSGSLANFNVTIPAEGRGYSVRFDRAGGTDRPESIDCVFHSNMRAWIFVFDHPFFKLTEADGQFKFVDVPVGTYELQMVHSAGGLRWRQPIEIKAGETMRVDIHVSAENMK